MASKGGGSHQLGPKDIHTQSGLTKLYNEPVTKVEHMHRPMKGGFPVDHHGVRYVNTRAVVSGYNGQFKLLLLYTGSLLEVETSTWSTKDQVLGKPVRP